MKIAYKLTAVTFCSFIVLIIGVFFLSYRSFDHSMVGIEKERIEKIENLVLKEIDNAMSIPLNKIVDWSQWEDTYQFVKIPIKVLYRKILVVISPCNEKDFMVIKMTKVNGSIPIT
jgi:hypothetical protein